MKILYPPFAPLLALALFITDVYIQSGKLNTAFYYSFGIAMDKNGNAFVTGKNNKIIKITTDGKAELFAGGAGDGRDGKGKQAGFSDTQGIAIDPNGVLYVADRSRIRKITQDGTVSTIAGISKAASIDGDLLTASFLHVENIAVDNKGNIYVTDYAPGKNWRPGMVSNSTYYYLRKISAAGMVTTLQDGKNGPLTLQYPRGLACDGVGNLYVNASSSHCIKKISPEGNISTVAGQCDKTTYHSVYKPGTVTESVLTTPTGLAVAPNGDIYFSDVRLNRIIKIANGKVITVAGAGKISFTGNIGGAADNGEADGKALQATFYNPLGIAFDKSGNLFIVDGSSRNNSYIRKLSTDGIVSTFCKHIWNPTTQQYEQAD